MQMFDREVNESIVIGDDIEITVLEIQDDFVRISISSPQSVPSYRVETIFLEESSDALELAFH